jgi:predicted RNA-binding Zn-ribbon protein involved in translation (DUF1610 family)
VSIWRCDTCGDLLRWCPGCDQGWIRRAKIKKKSVEVFVCEECETVWQSEPETSATCSGNLGQDMKADGLTGDWSELEVIAERE